MSVISTSGVLNIVCLFFWLDVLRTAETQRKINETEEQGKKRKREKQTIHIDIGDNHDDKTQTSLFFFIGT